MVRVQTLSTLACSGPKASSQCFAERSRRRRPRRRREHLGKPGIGCRSRPDLLRSSLDDPRGRHASRRHRREQTMIAATTRGTKAALAPNSARCGCSEPADAASARSTMPPALTATSKTSATNHQTPAARRRHDAPMSNTDSLPAISHAPFMRLTHRPPDPAKRRQLSSQLSRSGKMKTS